MLRTGPYCQALNPEEENRMDRGPYYFTTTVAGAMEEVSDRVREALTEEGFGVLTQIDVRTTLRKKLDVEFRPYLILGACNPSLAYRTLQAEEHIGIMLPCNVVIQEKESGRITVSAMDPARAMSVVKNRDIEPVAEEVSRKLIRVLESLQAREPVEEPH